ncbi:S-adenosyl-L-methionine-dependent methyltransferase [Cutaneotrichosporon oleaginosum]|uniref:rRNA adenine N(6)-methyltransferase n=1 Tax=Cutaneotrichosporon oleaginosum TaxID=879819 RepID=A0A0J0XUI0_9TREE|nr:S-adenosyl-L-methionine-dependent methyltransferase [Cutaneotrichosporon oleaginosum]KLT44766.1 S-adenosyl-L-methionine-dependent methyltransferase [Cutaneotrichosporon oleaginosum]TXT07752.1 hypothetical protein COLE_04676 [Cutaneotrichosporon oleaginosum]
MPRLRLPPLPSPSQWSKYIPRTGRYSNEGAGARELLRRTVVASKKLTDSYVRALGIRKDEVILEAYPSLGQLTRSLLAGGVDTTSAADWEQVTREQEIVGPRAGKVKRRNIDQFDYPEWDVSSVPANPVPKGVNEKHAVVPKAVVAIEPLITQLSRGLGFDPDLAPSSYWDYNDAKTEEELKKIAEMRGTTPVYPSILQKNLLLCPDSVFEWHTIPRVLDNPLVWEKLPVYDESKEGVESRMRPWDAPPPPLSVVATMPETVLGDQLIAQWVSSAIGEPGKERGWLWAFGRVRLAMFVPKTQYDRLMASPGETIHCKLSVMANALFQVRPLPPYHHVPDVDKQSTRTNTDYETALRESAGARVGKGGVRIRHATPAPPPIDEVTETHVGDFWPQNGRLVGRSANVKVPEDTKLPRPPMLGVELIPRLDSPIRLDQREEWEFVLRHCFVQEARPLSLAMPKLGFGAENLIPKIRESETTSKYAGLPCNPETTVRHLTIEQWQRIVDVFAKWPFKPELLMLDSLDDNRQIGTT